MLEYCCRGTNSLPQAYKIVKSHNAALRYQPPSLYPYQES